MGRPLTSAEREEKGALAYEMSLLGKSQRKISQEIGVHHSTVASLLREQIQHRRKERKDSVHSLLDGFDAAIANVGSGCQLSPRTRLVRRLPSSSAE